MYKWVKSLYMYERFCSWDSGRCTLSFGRVSAHGKKDILEFDDREIGRMRGKMGECDQTSDTFCVGGVIF